MYGHICHCMWKNPNDDLYGTESCVVIDRYGMSRHEPITASLEAGWIRVYNKGV